MFFATGLIALDLIRGPGTGPKYKRSVGGSCGNVATITSLADVPTVVCARIGADPAGRYLKRSLKAVGADVRLLTMDLQATPSIVQRTTNEGRHSFSFRHPVTGAYLPRFSPPTISQVAKGIERVRPTIVYADRLFSAVRTLSSRHDGSPRLIVVEPSHRVSSRDLERFASGCDVLKISADHLSSGRKVLDRLGNLLQVVTYGDEGLEFRLNSQDGRKTVWRELPSKRVTGIVDTAGAGDWVTGSLISLIWNDVFVLKRSLGIGVATRALRLGVGSAAISCQYLGAQGALSSETGRNDLTELWSSVGIRLRLQRFTTSIAERAYLPETLPL